MPDWKTKLEVRVNGRPITPVTSFIPVFKTPRTVLHSLEQDNVGVIHQPRTATFTMKIPANNEAVAMLTQMALDGTMFDIAVVEKEGTEWAFNTLGFQRCVITSANPSDLAAEGDVRTVPVATFSGAILGFGTETIES